jgi:MoaA/NifB/PqqE/SkfB family radical SAM enzyme
MYNSHRNSMIPKPTTRAVIDVGHKCNVKCQHCYYAHESGGCFKSAESIIKEINSAVARGNNYIDFTGGEPSIHPAMPTIIKHCTDNNIGTCIITNGIAGKNTIANILHFGIDDWLISVHGMEKTHNTIVQLKDARARQERFIKQLVDAGSSFRFNCTLTKWNQKEILRLAKWAVQFKPRIFNFINFNPHHEWQKDTEGTKNVIADLRIIEPQINDAIALLEDAGIGVNLRYYPMCRVNEPYRRAVCNDLQVLFDPYEWDYDIVPKDYRTYYNAGTKLSIQNEWKGQPCQSCDIRYICGGLNSAFHQASGRNQIDAIKDDSVVRDDVYHYRRKNTLTITNRKPIGKRSCICAIVDEAMVEYVPVFLYTAYKAYPDIDVKVFMRCDKDGVHKNLIDRYIGFGFYDACTVPVHNELTEYTDKINVTKAVRFIEFEKHLIEYDYVLFTDVDMLFVNDGDIIRKHCEQIEKDKTEVYENWLTIHNGYKRLSGVHFITKAWWDKTRDARGAIATEIKSAGDAEWDTDERELMRIVESSGLPVSPQEKRIWRHHAIHLGDVQYSIKNGKEHTFTEQHKKELGIYLQDAGFAAIIKYLSDHSDHFRKIAHALQSDYKPQQSYVIPTNITPIKKAFEIKNYTGSLCIVTLCDENYQWYVPVFLRSLERIREKQSITPMVLIRGKKDDAMLAACKELAKFVHYPMVHADYPEGGYATAALRFLYKPQDIEQFDYTLITDIDMLMFEETTSIINAHLMHMQRDRTDVYENWISQYLNNSPRLPGVHFVTKEWWKKTEKARNEEYAAVCKSGGITDYWYDEIMLGRIVQKSGLTLPPTEPKLWRHHGVHLGDWRLNIDRKIVIRPNVFESMHIHWMLNDPEMSNTLDICGEHIPLIKTIKKMWPALFK